MAEQEVAAQRHFNFRFQYKTVIRACLAHVDTSPPAPIYPRALRRLNLKAVGFLKAEKNRSNQKRLN